MAQRKLRDGPVIEIDDQILRWRSRIRKQEIIIGKQEENRRRKNAKQNAAKKEIDPTKRKWFE